MGTAFRPPKRRNKKECIDNWTQSIDQYIAKILRKTDIAGDYEAWKLTLIKIFEERFDTSQDLFFRHVSNYY